jgi:hypothetical protein
LIKFSCENTLENIKNFEELKDKNKIECFLSGKRSAIIFTENKNNNNNNSQISIRLKGCGNNFEGFPLEGEKNHKEIRGCQFKNTCLREQLISKKINEILQKKNFFCGNYPIGFYIYDSNFNQKLNEEKGISLKNEANLIEKYCGIFYTIGEKRLGSNFFKGFNYLLEKLFLNDIGNYNNDEIINIIDLNVFYYASNKKSKFSNEINKNNNEIKNENQNEKKTFSYSFSDFQYPLLDNLYEINDKENSYNNLFDFLNFFSNFENEKENKNTLKKALTTLMNLEINFINKFLIEDKSNKISNEKLRIYYLNLVETLKKYLLENKKSLFFSLINLFSNISYELGNIKKVMELNKFNWGTFDDHCNAHLDNLLLVKKNKFKKLISPIDFDLAFFENEFIDIKYKSLKGIEEKLNFEDLITRERLYLLIQLLGINPIPNIEVDVAYFRKVIECFMAKNNNFLYKNYLENLETLVKENISLYYSKGFCEDEEINLFFESNYELNVNLIELVLILEEII